MSESSEVAQREINILLGVTGSVATIKAAEVIEAIREVFADTKVNLKLVVTQRAKHFLPADISSSVEVIDDSVEWRWSKRGDEVTHVELARWADCFVIAPLDACSAAKMAAGICDNVLTCTAMAWHRHKPLLAFLSMNSWMYSHPATKANIGTLRSHGVQVELPISKRLMCGDVGVGAMQEPAAIARVLFRTMRENETGGATKWWKELSVLALSAAAILAVVWKVRK